MIRKAEQRLKVFLTVAWGRAKRRPWKLTPVDAWLKAKVTPSIEDVNPHGEGR